MKACSEIGMALGPILAVTIATIGLWLVPLDLLMVGYGLILVAGIFISCLPHRA
jgi:hypothetical protein